MPGGRPPWPSEVVATIEELAGKVSAETIAKKLGIRCGNLLQWAHRHGVALRRRPSKEHRHVLERLQAEARRQGLRLSSRNGKIVLLMPICEEAGITMDEAEALLSKRQRNAQHYQHERRLTTGQRSRATIESCEQDRSKVTLPSLKFLQREPPDAAHHRLDP